MEREMMCPCRWRLRDGFLLSCVLFLAAPARAGAETFPTALPARTLFFLSMDPGRALREFPNLDLVRLYRDGEVQDFLAPVIRLARANGGALRAARFLLASYGFPRLIRGRILLAVTGAGVYRTDGQIDWSDPDHDLAPSLVDAVGSGGVVIPEAVLCIETAGKEGFRSSLERLFELPPVEVSTVARRHDDFEYRVTSFVPGGGVGSVVVYSGFVGDDFVATFREQRLFEVVAALEGRATGRDSLATNPAFQCWQRAGTRGTEMLRLYVGVGQLGKDLAPFFPRRVRQAWWRASGLSELNGVGYALALDSGRLRETFAAVLPEQRSGALRLLDALEPLPLAGRERPAAGTAALACRIDASLLFDRVMELLGEFAPQRREEVRRRLDDVRQTMEFDLRDDLLASLGKSVSCSASVPRSGIIPGLTGCVELRDPRRFSRVLEGFRRLVGAIDAVRFGTVPIAGHGDAEYIEVRDAPIHPAFCVDEDRLVFALSVPDLKKALASLAAQGCSERPREGGEDFEKCASGIPGSGLEQVAAFGYIDLAAAVRYGLTVVENFVPQVLRRAPVPLDASLFPLPETISSYLSGMLVTVRLDDCVVAVDLSSPFGGIALSAVAAGLVRFSP